MAKNRPKRKVQISRVWRKVCGFLSQPFVREETRAWHQVGHLDRRLQKALHQARKKGATWNDLEEIRSGFQLDIELAYEFHAYAFTDRLRNEAHRLMVGMPENTRKDEDDNEYWERSQNTGQWYLTHEGVSKLMADLAQRRLHELNIKEPLYRQGSFILAVVAAIIALVALLK